MQFWCGPHQWKSEPNIQRCLDTASSENNLLSCVQDSRKTSSQNHNRQLPGRDIVPVELRKLSAFFDCSFRQPWSSQYDDALHFAAYSGHVGGVPGARLPPATTYWRGRIVQGHEGDRAGAELLLSPRWFEWYCSVSTATELLFRPHGLWVHTIFGPLVSGLFAEHTTWRWAFDVNVPFCDVRLLIVPLVVTLKVKRSSLKKKVLQVDWVGAALFAASLTGFFISIAWSGVQ